jgi:hypothetical protein
MTKRRIVTNGKKFRIQYQSKYGGWRFVQVTANGTELAIVGDGDMLGLPSYKEPIEFSTRKQAEAYMKGMKIRKTPAWRPVK